MCVRILHQHRCPRPSGLWDSVALVSPITGGVAPSRAPRPASPQHPSQAGVPKLCASGPPILEGRHDSQLRGSSHPHASALAYSSTQRTSVNTCVCITVCTCVHVCVFRGRTIWTTCPLPFSASQMFYHIIKLFLETF